MKCHRAIFLLYLLLAAPLTGWASDGRVQVAALDFPLTITQPGSYVLVESVVVTQGIAGAAIRVEASNVTLDLGGHSMTWAGAGLDSGIRQTAGHGLRVRNGSLEGFGRGIVAGALARVDDVRMVNVRHVVEAGEGSILRNVQASELQPANDPLIDVGDASHLINLQLSQIQADLNPPTTLVQAGEATRARSISIQSSYSDGDNGMTAGRFGAGSVVDGVSLRNITHNQSTLIGLEIDAGVLSDVVIDYLGGFAFTAVGVVARDSIVHRVTAELLVGSAWRGIDVTRSWLADSRVFSDSPASPRGLVLNSSLALRNVVDGGYVDVPGTGSLLRENQVLNTGFQSYQLPAAGGNLAYRNTGATTAGAMISNNHHARLEVYPVAGFIATNNPWANIRGR
jgi:hypothetical protein